MKKNSRAFSLIELSVVILIIGFLIAGVAQTSKIIRKASVASAQSLTKQSIVKDTSGLVLWLESTSDKSFDDTIGDGLAINTWYDSNPQAINKSNASDSWAIGGNAAQKPIYTENAINGLPALNCKGTSTIGVNSGSYYYPAQTPYVTNSFTVFFVAFTDTTHEIDVQANSGTAGASGQKYIISPTYAGGYGSNSISGMGVSMGTNGVSVYENTGGYLPPLAVYNGLNSGLLSRPSIVAVDYNNKTPTIYVDGGNGIVGLQSSKTVVAPNGFCASDQGGFVGYLGEVIVFNRHLLTEERKAIERYLSKKWKIDLV